MCRKRAVLTWATRCHACLVAENSTRSFTDSLGTAITACGGNSSTSASATATTTAPSSTASSDNSIVPDACLTDCATLANELDPCATDDALCICDAVRVGGESCYDCLGRFGADDSNFGEGASHAAAFLAVC